MGDIQQISTNQTGYQARRSKFDGREHLVVPVVMAREGVMNGAFVSAQELGRFVESWNGRPVPVLHPKMEGQAISANAPSILERTIGKLFNAHMDGSALKAEAWLDINKADILGYGELLNALETGTMQLDVSTGYFSEVEQRGGEFNGNQYQTVHTHLRPDHLALLPGEIGACSWADGCGVRANEQGGLVAAFNTLANKLGFTKAADCGCNHGGHTMAISKYAEQLEKLQANEMITPKQLTVLQSMDEEQLEVAMSIIRTMLDKAEAKAEPAPAPEAPAPEVNLKDIVTNQVRDFLRRDRVMEKLSANAANAFTDAQMQAMTVDALEAYEQSIRPADYSGQAGFSGNNSNAAALGMPAGIFAKEA